MEINRICFENENKNVELTNLDWVSDKIAIYNLKEANEVYLDATLVLTEMLTFFDNNDKPVELNIEDTFTFKGKQLDMKDSNEHQEFIQKVIFDSVKNQEQMAESGKN